MPGSLLSQPPWPPRSQKRTALGQGQLGSGRIRGLRPQALTHSPPSLDGPSPVLSVGKASSTPSDCRPTRPSAGEESALEGLQGGDPAPGVPQEWTLQPCHQWPSEVALSMW